MQIRLLACDLMGTIHDEKGIISVLLKEKLEKVKVNGLSIAFVMTEFQTLLAQKLPRIIKIHNELEEELRHVGITIQDTKMSRVILTFLLSLTSPMPSKVKNFFAGWFWVHL